MDVETFRSEARAWLAEHHPDAPPNYGAILPPEIAEVGKTWQRRLFDAGWAGIHWPTEHGGRGLTPEHSAAWGTECALAEVPPFINMVGVVLAGGALLSFGTPDQQAEHLRPIITGEKVWCQLFSEPDAGSDLAGLRTRAEPAGAADGSDGWLVTGTKVWCSNGRVADRGILMARTDPDAPKHKGISFFVIDMATPGIEVRPLRQMTGGSEFDEVFLEGAHLPADALLGPLHGGWGVAMAVLTNERGHIGGAGISLGRRLDALAASGADDPLERQRLAELLARGRALHAMGSRQGPVASVAASLSKLGVTELMFDAALHEADRLGAASMLADEPAVRGLLGAPGGRIAGGTTQVQKNIIGERLLGLPKEPT